MSQITTRLDPHISFEEMLLTDAYLSILRQGNNV